MTINETNCNECNTILSITDAKYGICIACQELAILDRYKYASISVECTYEEIVQVSDEEPTS